MVPLGDWQARVLGVSHVNLMQFCVTIDGHKLFISLYLSYVWQVMYTRCGIILSWHFISKMELLKSGSLLYKMESL